MDIRIQKLNLKNFKCYAEQSFEFGYHGAQISGHNGVGKSTIFDAIIWCLTGKLPNAKAEGASIRPVGEPVEVVPEVEVTAVVDGVETVFVRRLEATYTGRGLDKTYKGDATTCSIDSVPKSVTEFNAFVSQLFPINPTVWLDLLAFADDTKFSADERRSVLIEAFGNVSEDDIKALNADFDTLFNAKGKLSVEDYKTAMKEQEKNCTAELGRGKTIGTLQARIDEAAKAIVRPDLSVSVQEKRIADLEAEIKEASAGDTTDIRTQLSALRKELASLERDISSAVDMERQMHIATYFDMRAIAGHTYDAARSKVDALESAMQKANAESADLIRQIDDAKKRLASLEEETITVDETCPTCGQPLPKEQIDEAYEKYNEDKAIKMETLEKRIESLSKNLSEAKARLAQSIQDKKTADADKEEKANELAKAEKDYCEAVNIKVKPPKELTERKESLLADIDALEMRLTMSGTSEQVQELTAQLKAEQTLLAEAQANDRQRERIEQLRNRQKEVAEMLSDAQRMIALCDEFIVAKAHFIEQSISSHFEGVTFRLFDVFKNGELKNSCVPIFEGKPFSLLSFSQKTVASIAILKGLAQHYGFTCVSMIDNASEMDSQTTARLETAGQKLIIKVSDGDFRIENI